MEIIRKSPKFEAFLKETRDARPEFVGYEEVSLGYRQELGVDNFGNESMLSVEVFGPGAELNSFEWPDDWGAPPSEQDLDNWEPAAPVEEPSLTPGEKALKVKEAVNTGLCKLYVELADELGVEEASNFVIAVIAKALKK